MVYHYGHDIFVLSETWLSDNVAAAEISLPGYEIERADRQAVNPGGGVAILYKSEMKIVNSRTMSFMSKDIELLTMYFIAPSLTNRDPLVLTAVYRTPTGNMNNALSELDSYFIPLLPTSSNFICIGDFNIDYSDVINLVRRNEMSAALTREHFEVSI